MAIEPRYFCTGTCGAVITQQQYDEGLTKCGAEGCTLKGQTFEKGIYCTVCKKRISEEERKDHQHPEA